MIVLQRAVADSAQPWQDMIQFPSVTQAREYLRGPRPALPAVTRLVRRSVTEEVLGE